MSILDKLNKISGKTADNIEEAIDNIETGGGGGGGVLRVEIEESVGTWTSEGISLTANVEPLSVYNAVINGSYVLVTAPMAGGTIIVFNLINFNTMRSSLLFSSSIGSNEFSLDISPDGFIGRSNI